MGVHTGFGGVPRRRLLRHCREPGRPRDGRCPRRAGRGVAGDRGARARLAARRRQPGGPRRASPPRSGAAGAHLPARASGAARRVPAAAVARTRSRATCRHRSTRSSGRDHELAAVAPRARGVAARHADRRRRRRQDPPRDPGRGRGPAATFRMARGSASSRLASDPEAMVQVVAAALGVQPRPGVSIEDRIIEFLRHQAPAPRAGQLRAPPRRCGAVRRRGAARRARACASWRRAARASRSTASTCGRCARSRCPTRRRTSRRVVRSDAGRLFVDRARAVDPTFALDASTGAAVGELCRRLDGVPLAIELAAARIVAMSPAEIAARLDERFRLLTGGRRAAVERHQTLRATVDWSFSLCSPTEQLVFARLGVFAGPSMRAPPKPSQPARASSGGTSSTRSRAWSRKSMVVGDRAADGSTRYSMLETLRAYARERLDETDDADRWRRRHAEHYAGFAERGRRGSGRPRRARVARAGARRARQPPRRDRLGARLRADRRCTARAAHRRRARVRRGHRHDRRGRRLDRARRTRGPTRPRPGGAPRSWAPRRSRRSTSATTNGRRRWRSTRCATASRPTARSLSLPTPRSASFELNRGRPDEALRVMRRGLARPGGHRGPRHLQAEHLPFHSSRCSRRTAATSRPLAPRPTKRCGSRVRSAIRPLRRRPCGRSGRALIRADPAASLAAYEGYVVLARSGAKSANLGWSLGDVRLAQGTRRRPSRCAACGARRRSARPSIGQPHDARGHAEPHQARVRRARRPGTGRGARRSRDRRPARHVEHRRRRPKPSSRIGTTRSVRSAPRSAPTPTSAPPPVGAAMTFDEVVDYTLDELERLLAEASA